MASEPKSEKLWDEKQGEPLLPEEPTTGGKTFESLGPEHEAMRRFVSRDDLRESLTALHVKNGKLFWT